MKTTHPLSLFRFCPKCGSEHFETNDNKSKKCASCGFVYYLNPSAATVALIFNEQKQLLVCRRAQDPARGTLDLPGGFCDCFETAEEGVVREVKEETGLDVIEVQYLFTQSNRYLYSGFTVHTMDLFFICRVNSDRSPIAMDDASACYWIPVHQLNPEDFGLQSIRQGIQKMEDENLWP